MILGIMGGMGPEATCDMFRKITKLTCASKDQEHLHIIIDSNSQIPDRTQYICGTGEDPRIEMIRSVIKLEMMGADYIVMPCNTAHFFYDDIVQYTKSYIIHMIRETAMFLKEVRSDVKTFILLATEGTYISGVYKKIFKEYELNIIEPDYIDKKTIMAWIYKVKSGVLDVTLEEFEFLVNKYMANKRVSIILGCTELPLLVEAIGFSREYIDPVSIVAKRCVDIVQNHTAYQLTRKTIPMRL